jgi:hypothetical protein
MIIDPLVILTLHIHFIDVHGPDNQLVKLNAQEISSVREVRDTEADHFGKDVECIVFMNNGKFIGTRESCPQVLDLIEKSNGDMK